MKNKKIQFSVFSEKFAVNSYSALGKFYNLPPHFPPSPLKDVSTQFEGWGGGGGKGVLMTLRRAVGFARELLLAHNIPQQWSFLVQ